MMFSPLLAALCLLAVPQEADRPQETDWPQFRGPSARGVATDAPLPRTFEKPTWKVDVPGLSHASPIIAGERVFIATAIAEGKEASLKVGLYGDGDSADDLVSTEFRLIALDVATGKELWNTLAVTATPPFGRHTKATQANSTPAYADGAVVALFGSSGLFCLDAATGETRWHVELGPLDCGPWNVTDLEWGFASSPIIHDGHVLVQADVKSDPFLAAFRLEDGKEIWRTKREDVNTWTTPTVARVGDEDHVLVGGCKHMGAYRLKDGSEVWRMSGGGGIPVPTPVVSGTDVILTSNHRPIDPSHPLKPVFAVPLAAKGNLGVPSDDSEEGSEEGSSITWMATRCGNYMQTPLVYRDHIWLCYDSGMLTCLDATTGEQKFRERIQDSREGFTASMVAADGLLYITSEEGNLVLVEAKPEFKVAARIELGGICMATPAIVTGKEGAGLIYRMHGAVVRYDE